MVYLLTGQIIASAVCVAVVSYADYNKRCYVVEPLLLCCWAAVVMLSTVDSSIGIALAV